MENTQDLLTQALDEALKTSPGELTLGDGRGAEVLVFDLPAT